MRQNPRVNALLVALRKVRDTVPTLEAAQAIATIAIEEYVNAAPGSPSPDEPHLCLKCRHNDVSSTDGYCVRYSGPDGAAVMCGCKCEFPRFVLQ